MISTHDINEFLDFTNAFCLDLSHLERDQGAEFIALF